MQYAGIEPALTKKSSMSTIAKGPSVAIEKETVIKEVRGTKSKKVTVRVLIETEGKTRSILFTPNQFKRFKKEVADTKI